MIRVTYCAAQKEEVQNRDELSRWPTQSNAKEDEKKLHRWKKNKNSKQILFQKNIFHFTHKGF